MDYTNWTIEGLISRIEELELLNHQLVKEKDMEVGLDYPWTGNLGHWYWNVKTNVVTFNLLKVLALGYQESEIPEHISYQFFTEKLHPEDYPRTMKAMIDHLEGKATVYEVEYRIKAKDGSYKWYYDRGKITQYDENGKPLFLAGIVFDITKNKNQQEELQRKNRQLEELATLDGLTKIRNHKTLIEVLEIRMEDAIRSGDKLSVAFFDIDDFKKINDTYGHVAGDMVLCEIAGILKGSVRKGDVVGRYGGEEFFLILPHTNLSQATELSERIRMNIENNRFSNGIHLKVSGGVKQFTGETLTELIDCADQNLYRAKKLGKNKIENSI